MSTTPTKIVTDLAQIEEPRIRLDFLDGVRGLAALYIVFFHVFVEINYRPPGVSLPHIVAVATRWMIYGHAAVAIFIVLSGYCLMLPVVRSANSQLPGGIGQFLSRRARRILPPYYAAIGLALLLIAVTTRLRHMMNINWADMLPAYTPGVLLSHLLLVHNLSGVWIGKIDSPMWSVALECQIYFVFALLLLPVWRRWGILAAIIVAFTVGLAPHYLLPHTHNFDQTFPWYLGLFSFGMGGAVLGFSEQPSHRRLNERLPWGLLSVLLVGVYLLPDHLHIDWFHQHIWQGDVFVGASIACMIIYCTRSLVLSPTTERPTILRLLEARWTLALGTFSYSLYLVHDPLIALARIPLLMLHLSHSLSLFILSVGAVPLIILVAYLFHVVFERPFLRTGRSSSTYFNRFAFVFRSIPGIRQEV